MICFFCINVNIFSLVFLHPSEYCFLGCFLNVVDMISFSFGEIVIEV